MVLFLYKLIQNGTKRGRRKNSTVLFLNVRNIIYNKIKMTESVNTKNVV